jgi:hypothetical protein
VGSLSSPARAFVALFGVPEGLLGVPEAKRLVLNEVRGHDLAMGHGDGDHREGAWHARGTDACEGVDLVSPVAALIQDKTEVVHAGTASLAELSKESGARL